MLTAVLLAACATPDAAHAPKPEAVAPKPSKPRVPETAPVAPVERQSSDPAPLAEGINLYNNGEYNASIKRLGSAPEIWSNGTKSAQTTALKYMAFSYCVTGRQVLCRQQFEKALKLDPAFDLAPGENGHPLWGPAFARAKKKK